MTLRSLLMTFIAGATALMAADEKRLLIIGNSYTFYNDLPAIVQSMAHATRTPLHVDSYTAGAMSLRGFLNSPQHARCKTMLREGEYDWVLLQDQSQTPAQRPTETLNSVAEWSQLAAASGTKVALFLTWAHAAQEDNKLVLQSAMQNDTGRTYCQAAIQNKAKVAPVGEAWRRWYAKHPQQPLHTNDLSHPTAEGSYLAACVIYGTITGKSPVGLPAAPRNTKIRLNRARARELQKTAELTLRKFSPADYLNKLSEQDRELPSPDDIVNMLSKGMKINLLHKKLGKPHLVTKNSEQVTYQYRLRHQAELAAYCTRSGTIQQISIATPGNGVRIIDLNELESSKN